MFIVKESWINYAQSAKFRIIQYSKYQLDAIILLLLRLQFIDFLWNIFDQIVLIIKINYNVQLEMLENYSPQKENRSPELKRREKIHKQLKNTQQILECLRSQGITLSSHLQNKIFHDNQSIQLFDSHKDYQSAQKMRVKISDYQFEIKKLQQDFAEFKLLARMEKEKAVKKIKDELDYERNKNAQESRKWEKRFEERTHQYAQECERYRLNLNVQMNARKQYQLNQLNQKHKLEVSQLQKELTYIQNQHFKELNQLREELEAQIKQINQEHSKEVIQINLSHQNNLKKHEQIFESKITVIQIQKKAEIKSNQDIKKQSSKNHQKLLHQIGKIEFQKKKLQEQNQQLDMRLKVLNKRYQDRGKDLDSLKIQHQEQLNKLQSQKQMALEQANKSFEDQKLRILKEQYAKMQKFEDKYIKMQEIKDNLEQNFKNMFKTLETRFNRRESKRQDVEFIKSIQQQLVHKQKQTCHIYEQLKLVKLEKENNQKIYTRIFTSNPKVKKSMSYKTDRDIYSLIKQSQTTDCRHLLKISQK